MDAAMSLEALQGVVGGRAELVAAMCRLVPGGVAWFDSAGVLRAHNPQFERIVGVLPATVGDLPLRPLAGRGAPSPLERAMAGQGVDAEEFEWARADGASCWVRLSATPMPDRPGAGHGALVVIVDVAEQHGLDIVRQQVLGVVAHDLRNPLSALRMTTSLLAKPAEMPPPRRVQLAERMLGTIGRMEGMVNALLEYARAEAGVPVRLTRERVDIGSTFERVKKEMEIVYPGRAVGERRVGRLEGLWDGPRIERVVTNLLSNALKHGRDDAPVEVVLDGSAATEVSMTVHNQGAPIDPDLLPKIFEPFTVGPLGQDGRRRSVGLGLFIVKYLVGAHGGTVAVRSTAEEGTTFEVTLPRETPRAGGPGDGATH
jgi:PAS domain S-box-containing protein